MLSGLDPGITTQDGAITILFGNPKQARGPRNLSGLQASQCLKKFIT